MSYLRCAAGASLSVTSRPVTILGDRPPIGNATAHASNVAATTAVVHAAAAAISSHQDDRASSAATGESAVWPPGCDDAYSERVANEPSQCMPERFFFSYAEGELPAAGHDLLHLHDVLNRTNPSALVCRAAAAHLHTARWVL